MRVSDGPGHVEVAAPASKRPSMKPAGERAAGAEERADYNLRIVWTLARYVEERYGIEGLRDVASAGGLQPGDFDGSNRWVSWKQFEDILTKARSLMESDDEFKRACVHRLKEAYGPLRYVLWATSPAQVFVQGGKQYRLVSNSGHLSVTSSGRTWAHMTFTSQVPFSRLTCLIRQAQSETMPTLWGLLPARVREDACVARGDASCELHVHWYAGQRWFPTVGVAGGLAVAAYFLAALAHISFVVAALVPLVGGLLAYIGEERRTRRLNEKPRQEIMGAFQQLAQEEADARREVLEMHGRQKEWTRVVEDEMSSRAAAFEKISKGLKDLQEARTTTLLGFSHDLRNPLQIIKMSVEYLKTAEVLSADTEAVESVKDLAVCVERMQLMLGDLVQTTKAQRDFVTMTPRPVSTSELSESLRRRIKALLYGREIRASVFATREAPEMLEIDPLALDRIIDNLLTNAAKYTERGSIVLELDGRDGFLVIKVSDTGRGIAADALEKVFEPGGSSLESRRGDSYGVGLSVVVKLLEQMGGNLEVMSRPGSGTTFWVYLPVKPGPERRTTEPGRRSFPPESTSPRLSRVVSIRKQTA
jgi:signal transduction histidine kinase